jgi:hypothetical protein
MEKRRISSRQFVEDIREGMSDQALMEKYAISYVSLQSIFGKLVDSGRVQAAEIVRRGKGPQTSGRSTPRADSAQRPDAASAREAHSADRIPENRVAADVPITLGTPTGKKS